MGNCAGFFFTKEEKKTVIKSVKKIDLQEALEETKNVKQSRKCMDEEVHARKIQSYYRIYQARKKLRILLKNRSDQQNKTNPEASLQTAAVVLKEEHIKIEIDLVSEKKFLPPQRVFVSSKKFNDGSVYSGETLLDKFDGFGMIIHKNGDTFIGSWEMQKASGLGKYISPNGEYHGNFQGDLREGYGQEKWSKGSSYEGEYSKGQKCGYGIFCFENGASFEGLFGDNGMCGLGTYYFKDSKKYKGEWRNNKMNGFGIIEWPDGRCFEGQFLDDRREGFGIFYNTTKIFLGNWKNSKLEGAGIIISMNGFQKAIWVENKMTETLSNEAPLPFDFLIDELMKENYE